MDEASVACRSRFGADLIYFNPTKPGGKFHFRFYFICDAATYACLRIRVHTPNKSDLGDPTLEGTLTFEEYIPADANQNLAGLKTTGLYDDDELQTEIDSNNKPGLLVSLVLDMCKPYFHTGRVVNMDNYYTSPEVAYCLVKNNLYMRGTCRTNRKGFPVGVVFSKSDAGKLERGETKVMMDHGKGITAYGWLDGNPVHFLTTADGNSMATVYRRIGREKKNVPAPIAVKKYNKGMQAVDRHDQLRKTFSLAERHGFKKYYVKMALGIMDMVLVNSWIHYKLVNPEKCKESGARFDFVNTLTDQLLYTNWQEDNSFQDSGGEKLFESLCDSMADNTAKTSNCNVEDEDILNLENDYCRPCSNTNTCVPVAVQPLLASKRSKRKGLDCQICRFEGSTGTIGSVVICLKHRIRCCTKTRGRMDLKKLDGSEMEDYSWRSPQASMTCWEKAHRFYIPRGLFKDDVDPLKVSDIIPEKVDILKFQCVRVTSDLNERKRKALGQTSRRGRKKQKK